MSQGEQGDKIDQEDYFSVTTSMLADRIVERIGAAQDLTGSALCCRNSCLFITEGCKSQCGSGKRNLGFQEQIYKELFKNQRNRHGDEEDWGLVVADLNK